MRPPNSFPLLLTTFIGRERELSDLKRRVGDSRLLTLTGAGGVGKTRLALELVSEIAADFLDGACFVELAGISDPRLIDQFVVDRLGAREEAGQGVAEALADYLKDKELLLVFDNCEHLLDGCAETAERLLSACPGLKILTTSREALDVPGEVSWPVPPLSLQPTKPARGRRSAGAAVGAQVQRPSEAARLFEERAHAILSGFALTANNAATVDQICRRLDGIPLAVELAAARIRTLSPQQIADRLDDCFRLLTASRRTTIARQQTLRATVDWSHDLLSEPECVLFRRLSVFAGGWTLEAAEAVCSDGGLEAGDVLDLLSNLTAKSLVVVEQREEQSRFRLLETLRQYAAEKLEQSEETPAFRGRHLEWFVALGEEAERGFRGREQQSWFRCMRSELDNVRTALTWSESADVAAGLRLAASLFQFWWLIGHGSEGRTWLDMLLNQTIAADSPPSSDTLAKAQLAAGFIALRQQDASAARPLLEASLDLWRELGRDRPIAFILRELGRLALQTKELDQAGKLLNKSLEIAQKVNDVSATYEALYPLALHAQARGELAGAVDLQERALRLERQQGDAWYMHLSLLSLAGLALARQDLSSARARLIESLEMARQGGEQAGVPAAVEVFACLAMAEGQALRTIRLAGAAAALREAVGNAMPGPAKAQLEHALETARRRLTDHALQNAWAEGRAMTIEQAAAYALDDGAPVGKRYGLSEREQEVAVLIARGSSNRQIAEALVIAERTAETHVEHILQKLGFTSRAQVAVWAAEQGLARGLAS